MRSHTDITAGQTPPQAAGHPTRYPHLVSDLQFYPNQPRCPTAPTLPHEAVGHSLTCANTPSAPPWGTQLPQPGHQPPSDLRFYPCPTAPPYGCVRAHTRTRTRTRARGRTSTPERTPMENTTRINGEEIVTACTKRAQQRLANHNPPPRPLAATEEQALATGIALGITATVQELASRGLIRTRP